jgi:hypothetical protein
VKAVLERLETAWIIHKPAHDLFNTGIIIGSESRGGVRLHTKVSYNLEAR